MSRKEQRKRVPIEKSRKGVLWEGGWWSIYEKNRAVALIGEDHQGNWANAPDALKDIEGVVDLISQKQKNATVKIWHEGDSPSDSFKSFLTWFKSEFDNIVQVAKWEPSGNVHKKEELLTMDLFAGDAAAFTQQLGVGGVLIERLVSKTNWRGANYSLTEDEIVQLVEKGNHSEQYMKLLYEPVSAASLRKWFKCASEVFEDDSSELFKLNEMPQLRREKALSALMLRNNGIFLCGDSHIEMMGEKGLLR